MASKTQCVVGRGFSKDLFVDGRISLNENLILRALDFKLSFLARGAYSNIILAEAPMCDPLVLRVSFYRKYMLKKKDDLPKNSQGLDSVIIDSMFSKAIRQYNIPGFVRIDAVAEINCPKLMNLIHADTLKKLTDFQLARPVVFAVEKYDSDLTDFLRGGHYDDGILKAIIFQVLNSLHSAAKHFKNFRHNDLSTNNVFIKLVRVNGNHTRLPIRFSFQVGDESYTRNFQTSVHTFIADFDFVYAQQPGFKNERIFNSAYRVSPGRNRAYDTNYFLFCVKKIVSQRFPKSSVVEWIKKFNIKKPRIVSEKPALFVEKLMTDDFFKS
jgi:hypothetical protein